MVIFRRLSDLTETETEQDGGDLVLIIDRPDRRSSRCELPARTAIGRPWQLGDAARGCTYQRLRVPVAVRTAVSS